MRNQCYLCDMTTIQLGELKQHIVKDHKDYFENLKVNGGEVDLSDVRTF